MTKTTEERKKKFSKGVLSGTAKNSTRP